MALGGEGWVMDKINYADWMTLTLTVIAYLWIIRNSCTWILKVAAREWSNRREKERRQRAVNELYDSFNLDTLESGSTMRITTRGSLLLVMYRAETKS